MRSHTDGGSRYVARAAWRSCLPVRSPRAAVQTLAWWTRSIPLYERCRARYGKRFTLRLLQSPPQVHLSDPAEIKEVFTAPPDVLHPGEGARDPRADRRRQLADPARRAPAPVPAQADAAGLPRRAHGGAQRAARGRDRARGGVLAARRARRRSTRASRRSRWRSSCARCSGSTRARGWTRCATLLTRNLELGAPPGVDAPVPPARQAAWNEFVARRDESDALLFELIDERRAEPDGEQRDDVLAMLLAARHEDGSPMSKQELRDELMTLLVAGHETTASELAWAFERLARTPAGAAPADRRDRLRRRRRLPDRDDPGDAAPPAGAPQRRAAPDQAAGRDRRLQLPRGRRADGRTPTWSTTTRRSTPTRTRSGPSASSTSRPAPTPGSRSAAAGGAASAPASRSSR